MNGRTAPGHAEQVEGTGRRRFLEHTVLGTIGMVASWLISRSYGWALAPAAEEPSAPPPTISPRQKTSHEDYMRQAIALAKRVPRLPFGALIVARQRIAQSTGHTWTSTRPQSPARCARAPSSGPVSPRSITGLRSRI